MNLRINGIILIFGIIIGSLGMYKLRPHDKIPSEIKIQTKTKIVKVIEKDGTITETTIAESKSDQRIVKPKYGVALYHNKSISLDARLGDLPLFFVIQSDLKSDNRIGIRFEF